MRKETLVLYLRKPAFLFTRKIWDIPLLKLDDVDKTFSHLTETQFQIHNTFVVVRLLPKDDCAEDIRRKQRWTWGGEKNRSENCVILFAFYCFSTHFLVCECYRLCIAKIYPEGIYPSFISQLQQRTRIIRHSRPSHRQNQYYLMTIWESGHHSWLILTYQQIPKNNYKVFIQAFGIDCTYWCSQISLIRIDGSNIATLSLMPPNVTNFRHRHGGTYIAQYHAGETYDDHPRTSLGGRTSTNGFRPEWQTTYLIGDPDPCFAYFASDFQGIPIAANDLLIINLFIRHHISTT